MAVLHHYSRISGLKTLDPKHQGTGAKGAENKYGVPDVRVTYFYREGTPTEDDVTQSASSRYTVEAPDEHLYDIGSDPKGILKQLHAQSQDRQVNPGQVSRDEMLGAIRDSGHHGFYNSKSALPHAVGMFHPTQPIKEESTQELNMNKNDGSPFDPSDPIWGLNGSNSLWFPQDSSAKFSNNDSSSFNNNRNIKSLEIWPEDHKDFSYHSKYAQNPAEGSIRTNNRGNGIAADAPSGKGHYHDNDQIEAAIPHLEQGKKVIVKSRNWGRVMMYHPEHAEALKNILAQNNPGKNMKKAQVDQGKSPEEKAKARGERHQRNVSTQFPGGGKADSHERRDIEEGKAPGRKGVWVGGDEPIQSGIQRSKNQFAGSKQKGLKAHAQQMNESRKIKPKLTKDESEDMPGEDLDKSKNVREQRAKVFGTKSQPAKGSPMRQKHMEHIRDYVKRKYGLEFQSSGGKWDEKTQGRRSDNPVVGEDKPDWRSGQLESQDNPEAQVHELAHLEELPEGTDLPEGQRLMDRRYSDVQKEHGYMKQKRSQGEIQPMAMENPIRRRMGLPATDISTPVKPGQEPRTAVDTGGPAAVRVPQGNKQVDLIRQTRLRSPENEDKQRQIDEGILTWTDKGWAPGTTPDAKINARQYMQEQGADPVQANQIAAQAGTPPMDNQMPEKMAASEGSEMDDETLRQMVKERFGVDLPGGSMDQGRILKLAEQYAHGSARKPMKRFEAPDEAQLPDLVKPTMQKGQKPQENKYDSRVKGVHRPFNTKGDVSAAGWNARKIKVPSEQKAMHERVIQENRDIKPNLPKSEFIKK